MLTLSQQQRLNSIQHSLSDALQYLGYGHCLPTKNNSDSQTLLEETIYNLLDVLPTFSVLQECTFTNVPKKQNIELDQQKALYNVLIIFAEMMDSMSSMAYLLYKQNYCQQVQKNFKKLYQLMRNATEQIYLTQFYQPGIQASKQKIFGQVFQNFRRIIKSQAQKAYFTKIYQESCNMASSTLTFGKNDSMDDLLGCDFDMKIQNPEIFDQKCDIIEELNERIAELEEQLQNQSQKHKKQLEKINQKLAGMQQKIHRYKLQIQSLQDDIARMQQQKYQDGCHIKILKDRINKFSLESNRKNSCFQTSPNGLKGLQLSGSGSFGGDSQRKSVESTYDIKNTQAKKNLPVFVSIKKMKR